MLDAWTANPLEASSSLAVFGSSNRPGSNYDLLTRTQPRCSGFSIVTVSASGSRCRHETSTQQTAYDLNYAEIQ